MKALYGKNVLITGGSSGIGLACARLFATQGYRVYACARSQGRQAQTFPSGGQIFPVIMDVCREDSVAAAVDSVIGDAGEIGILIHCAGMGIAGAAEDTPDAAARKQMDVNYFGVLNVNRRVLPHMRRSGRGLILMTGSVAGIFPIPFQSHYSSSKFALEAYARALRMELHEHRIKVMLIEPGDTKTGFTDARRFEIPPESDYAAACRASVAKMENDERKGRSPESAARVALWAAGRSNPPASRVVGFEYKLLAFLRRLLPERAVLFLLRKMYIK